jgi:hypothetical protein
MIMKSKFLLIVVLLLAVGNFAQAQDLHGSVDFTYQSKYLWRGFDIYGDKSAMQPSLDLDLFGTGLGVSAMGHRANSDGFENGERWDYTLYYQGITCPDEDYALMYRLGWVYYNYPQNRDQDADLQEIHATLSLPKMCPAGVVSSYTIAKLWPTSSGSLVGSPKSDGTASGFWHIFRLDYPLVAGGILPDTPEQVFNLSAETVFNDGVGPHGENVDHDWSHVVFGVSTGINLADGIVLTPGVYHQITMEKTVNEDKDETWANFSLTCNF